LDFTLSYFFTMHFHVITLFPEVCKAYTDASVLGRAQKTEKGRGAKHRGKKIQVSYYNPRDFATDIHNKTDDRPFGGGPGMVMKAEPLLRAVNKAIGKKQGAKVFIMSPRGSLFTNEYAKELAQVKDVVLISGRYEGIDARVKQILNATELSVGEYVLTGGELPALTVIDAVARQIPGVLGTFESLEDERVASNEIYTRPDTLVWKNKKYPVPQVLKSGNHKALDEWRKKNA
jgi:tRNA (guanine37-N1)-methyltransferase